MPDADQRAVAPRDKKKMAAVAREKRVRIARAALHGKRHGRCKPARNHKAGIARIGSGRAITLCERREQPLGPGSRGIDHEAGANVEGVPTDAVAGSDAGDARAVHEQAFRLDVVGYARAELGGRCGESEHEPRWTEHLPVLKHRCAGQTLELDRWKERAGILAA